MPPKACFFKYSNRREVTIIDIEGLVPKNHLVRKIERVMDYEWLYERLSPYYCNDNGRPGTDPVVIVKLVLLQHLFGIPSLRQTHRETEVNLAYRWFLGYGLLEKIPHFATVSYAFCKRFPPELTAEVTAGNVHDSVAWDLIYKRVTERFDETVYAVMDAKEKHAMRYTHHRGLSRVTQWVRLKFACMNLKKMASWDGIPPCFFTYMPFCALFRALTHLPCSLRLSSWAFFDKLKPPL